MATEALQARGEAPEVSIVVALIAGGREPTETCLSALEKSIRGRSAEVLVPYDARLDGVVELARRFPWVEFIDARDQVDAALFGRFSREHHDILRAIGLRKARGRYVAMLEDHGTPSQDWCDALAVALETDCSAVGGAVENGVDKLLNWAVYFCDFGRYMNPVPTGPAEFLSDSNLAYRREVLDSARPLWEDAFHETTLHWELRRRGHVLRLDPRMVVYQTRKSLRLWPALLERYVWGRSFAGTRAAEVPTAKRVVLAATSFLLPLVLTGRILALGLRKKRNLGKLVVALPLIVLLQTIWSLGEFVGYVTGRTGGPQSVPAAVRS